MRNALTTMLAGLIGMLAFTACTHNEAQPTPTRLNTTTAAKITEDMPGWNCRTMGNKRCGKRLDPRVFTACTRATYEGERLTVVPRNLRAACQRLADRPARQINVDASDPAGWVLVIECRSGGLSHTELGACLTQPV